VIEGILYEETELLEVAVRKLYNLIEDTAEFVVNYAKRIPSSTLYLLLCHLYIHCHTGRAISLKDHRKIGDLECDFRKLEEEFYRAVDVSAFNMARKIGKFWS
jgi:hypothetical protein